MSTPPIIEILPGPHEQSDFSRTPQSPGKKRLRLLLFIGVLTLCLASSLAYVWLRAPLYQTTASLLTVAPEEAGRDAPASATFKASKSPGGAPPSITLTDRKASRGGTEHVNLQRQILLGVPVFEETLKRYQAGQAAAKLPRLKLSDLRALLGVEMVPETNLVELRALGPQPDILAPLVNAWIDAYQALREQTQDDAEKNSFKAAEQEAMQLDLKIRMKRDALDKFRASHDILAKNDTDNTPMLRLKGINEALNKAIDEEVKANAKLSAIRNALAQGKMLALPEEAPGLENLEKQAQELRAAQKDLQHRFTPAYLAMHPQLKLIPGQLAQVEAELKAKAESSRRAVLAQAEQDYAAARQTTADLRLQVGELKRESAEFTSRFAEQETMQADLARLEEMHRDLQAKLAQAETKPKDTYPPLQVVERAYPPLETYWPDYGRDSGIALGASLLFALAFIGIYDYLTRIEEQPAPTPAAMPSFQFYSVQGSLPPRHGEGGEPASLPPQDNAPLALEQSPFPRELSAHEIRVLLDAADTQTRQWIGLLLSGLSVEEVAGLREENLDWDWGVIRLGGERPRVVPLAAQLKSGWASLPPAEDAEEVAARIHCAAFDSGLPQPESIGADALRHSYIAHLVRLGIRLSELERVVGRLPAKQLAAYGRYSPPGPGLSADRVPLAYPALA
ncbi:MAG: GumC family protein [Candidatus Methylumidiphilus sp.]